MPQPERIPFEGLKSETIADYIDGAQERSGTKQDKSVLPRAAAQKAAEPALAASLPARAVRKAQSAMRRMGEPRKKRAEIRARLTDPLKPAIDLSSLMDLSSPDFFDQIVFILYCRVAQPQEKGEFLKLIKQGAPHKAVTYILCCSDEMDEGFSIEDFGRYESAWLSYRNKKRILDLPVLNYFIALAAAPMRLKSLDARMRDFEVEEWEHASQIQEITVHHGEVLKRQAKRIRKRSEQSMRDACANSPANGTEKLDALLGELDGLQAEMAGLRRAIERILQDGAPGKERNG